jgi:hypothetical protein
MIQHACPSGILGFLVINTDIAEILLKVALNTINQTNPKQK